MRQRTYLTLLAGVLLGVVLPSAPLLGGAALAGSSSATLGVSLTIIAGCSVRAEDSTARNSTAVRCDNIVPYRVEINPATVSVVPENALIGEHRETNAVTVVVVY
jgi:hypothetical protein